MKKIFLLAIAACLILLSIPSCKKDSFITSPEARLRISADTVKFDTVFTSTGSITQSFKIVNENDQQLRLGNVRLMGGNTSSFKLNINGVAANQLTNIDIAANDSIYVFVSATVNPSSANLPFIISDSIAIEYNNNERWVQLQAYGQNAHFLRNEVISSNTTWANDLPYVIIGAVAVAADVTLTINPGVKIYAHANAPFIVDGTLQVNGNVSNKVVFTGDRLDEPYKNFPGSWPGIYFRGPSKNNVLHYAEIKNAYQAVTVTDPSSNANPKLVLHQCIIDNAFKSGVFCSNTSVEANNTLISNCANNIVAQSGGTYSFVHCTVASYSTSYLAHKTPVLSLANFATQSNSPVTNNLQANFTNCIFWGDNGFIDNEIVVSKQGNTVFNVTFTNCLYRAATDPPNTNLFAAIKNQDPLFDSIDAGKKYFDFRVTRNQAPGVNKGTATPFLYDLDNNARAVSLPDLGAYEKQ
jgi:hypothetical protein